MDDENEAESQVVDVLDRIAGQNDEVIALLTEIVRALKAIDARVDNVEAALDWTAKGAFASVVTKTLEAIRDKDNNDPS